MNIIQGNLLLFTKQNPSIGDGKDPEKPEEAYKVGPEPIVINGVVTSIGRVTTPITHV